VRGSVSAEVIRTFERVHANDVLALHYAAALWCRAASCRLPPKHLLDPTSYNKSTALDWDICRTLWNAQRGMFI
jgi:hypothetical protein